MHGDLPRRLPNGKLLVPRRAVSDDGQLVGEGVVEIGPEDPEYELWLPFVEAAERQQPPSSSS